MLFDLISKLNFVKDRSSKNPLQNFIYKYIADSTIVQRCYEEREREREKREENLEDIKSAQSIDVKISPSQQPTHL
jgi:hypothetical protein